MHERLPAQVGGSDSRQHPIKSDVFQGFQNTYYLHSQQQHEADLACLIIMNSILTLCALLTAMTHAFVTNQATSLFMYLNGSTNSHQSHNQKIKTPST
jgi:hypothetical protein